MENKSFKPDELMYPEPRASTTFWAFMYPLFLMLATARGYMRRSQYPLFLMLATASECLQRSRPSTGMYQPDGVRRRVSIRGAENRLKGGYVLDNTCCKPDRVTDPEPLRQKRRGCHGSGSVSTLCS